MEGPHRTITALQVQAKNKERVNVFLDDEFGFAVDLLTAAALRKGQALTDAEVAALQGEDEHRRAYQRAVTYLARRIRSRAEIERYLAGKGFDAAAIEAALQRLSAEGYLDDEEFTRAWVDDRERFRPRSTRALRQELRRKGVADDVIDDALAGVDEAESAWAAIQGKLTRWRSLDRRAFRRKIAGHLARRGFDFATVDAVVTRAWTELHGAAPHDVDEIGA